jgi:hypothetical protein
MSADAQDHRLFKCFVCGAPPIAVVEGATLCAPLCRDCFERGEIKSLGRDEYAVEQHEVRLA